jgi:hypothetical protein
LFRGEGEKIFADTQEEQGVGPQSNNLAAGGSVRDARPVYKE